MFGVIIIRHFILQIISRFIYNDIGYVRIKLNTWGRREIVNVLIHGYVYGVIMWEESVLVKYIVMRWCTSCLPACITITVAALQWLHYTSHHQQKYNTLQSHLILLHKQLVCKHGPHWLFHIYQRMWLVRHFSAMLDQHPGPWKVHKKLMQIRAPWLDMIIVVW